MTREEAQKLIDNLRNETKEIHILDILEVLGLIKFNGEKK